MKRMPQPTWLDAGKLAGRVMIDTFALVGTVLRCLAPRFEYEHEHRNEHAYEREHHHGPAPEQDRERPDRDDRRDEGLCACGGCEIPETECATRCIGPIELGAMTGQTVTAVVRVVNRAAVARTFTFSATPFTSGTSSAQFAFAPPSLSLAPGASGFTVASLTIPVNFTRGEYQAQIVVAGAYEQCVAVELEVGCEDMRSATAEIVQLDAAFRVRAHRWYDHFQCSEPC